MPQGSVSTRGKKGFNQTRRGYVAVGKNKKRRAKGNERKQGPAEGKMIKRPEPGKRMGGRVVGAGYGGGGGYAAKFEKKYGDMPM